MTARIVRNDNVFGEYFRIELSAKGIGRKARPGQFFMLKVGTGTDPLLRRPLSLHSSPSEDTVRFLYKGVGKGTLLLSRMRPNEEIDALGPLGNGFSVGRDVKQALLVAGGIGVAPLLGLAERLREERPDVKVVSFIGGRSADDVLAIREFREIGVRTYLCSEDSSLPRCGYVTETLEEYINKYAKHGTRGWTAYSCGPRAMMMSVAAMAKRHGIRNYASLEANMACGVGACMGCVVSIIDKAHGTSVYRKVCEDGPVFDVEDVVW